MYEIKSPAIERMPEYPGIAEQRDAQPSIDSVISRACETMLGMQRRDGYWWYTLEANETIGAEFIFLMHFLDAVEPELQEGISRRIGDVWRDDGTWALYSDGPADLSTTIECYTALKIAGLTTDDPRMRLARDYIVAHGGIPKARVFTKIHLAMFGLIPWHACPEMPAEAILLPQWFPLNIYEFSSWARATIVPLLAFMSVKPVKKLSESFNLDELYDASPEEADWSFTTTKSFMTWEYGFILLDKLLKYFEKLRYKPLRNHSINKCISWTKRHIERTEDIYPALAYAALMFKALGYSNDAPEIAKPLAALKRFQQCYPSCDLPACPDELSEAADGSLTKANTIDDACDAAIYRGGSSTPVIHQQCCISPVWDTPWMMTALIEAGVAPDAPALVKAARWLKHRQITEYHGDWAVKNRDVEPGGWSFEFQNDYFPDVDDTVQVLHVLEIAGQPRSDFAETLRRGFRWLLSMQNDDGGWAAFDRNNNRNFVNRIPFSDHGACLDPSSPDITGRVVELMARRGYSRRDKPVARALDYLWNAQEIDGSWGARWGINYVYGTWAVLTGLRALCWDLADPRIRRAVGWLLAAQMHDGGWGESPESYVEGHFVPWRESVPSQTAWGLMGLIAAGEAPSPAAERATRWISERALPDGTWDERASTGTGFPRHFYIRYHGYRHFFPLLALARYRDASRGI